MRLMPVGRAPPRVGGRRRSFIEAVAKAEIEPFDAIGLGEDLRLRASHVAGGALLAEGRVVHLCAFRVNAEEGAEPS